MRRQSGARRAIVAVAALLCLGLVAGGCRSTEVDIEASLDTLAATPIGEGEWDRALDQVEAGLGDAGDSASVGWVLADLMRFTSAATDESARLVEVYERATGFEVDRSDPWLDATNQLIDADIDAPANYLALKSTIFVRTDPNWSAFFEPDGVLDWRFVSWGGVLSDERPLDATDGPCPISCIPTLNDPAVTGVGSADWYADDRVVFGLVVNGEARAYPRHIMEFHEMVNDELGGRRIAMPYCTLCGSARAWFTDGSGAALFGVDRLELRTSGLLQRSNKLTFEFHTRSLIDSFSGQPLSGPLLAEGVMLESLPLVTTTWGEWKAAHPDTTILTPFNPEGWVYSDDPLRDRDEGGPIFPVGSVDPRLPTRSEVLGVIGESGPVAFDVASALSALADGGEVVFDGISITLVAGDLTATTVDGDPVASDRSLWFAWSQFNPTTAVVP